MISQQKQWYSCINSIELMLQQLSGRRRTSRQNNPLWITTTAKQPIPNRYHFRDKSTFAQSWLRKTVHLSISKALQLEAPSHRASRLRSPPMGESPVPAPTPSRQPFRLSVLLLPIPFPSTASSSPPPAVNSFLTPSSHLFSLFTLFSPSSSPSQFLFSFHSSPACSFKALPFFFL